MLEEKRIAMKIVANNVKGYLRENRKYNYALADKFYNAAIHTAEKKLGFDQVTALAVINTMINDF